MTTSEELFSIYERGGAAAYFGEAVSMSEHGLQAAFFARASGAADALVLAALLHDVGHLLEAVPEDIAEWKSDAHHELIGSRWLARRFGADVSEPVRLHVPAKRYLCAVDASYFDKLSAASVHTLRLQGGPMSAAEAAAFEREPFHRQAIRVRAWDDQGKVPQLAVPDFGHYRELIDRLALAGFGNSSGGG